LFLTKPSHNETNTKENNSKENKALTLLSFLSLFVFNKTKPQ